MKTEDKKKLAARTVRELYPYPHCPKEENLTKCAVWIASWLLGLWLPFVMGQLVLGGSYFIFAASMLVEFLPVGRSRPWASFAHGVFCFLLFVMLIGSFVLIGIPNVPAETDKAYIVYMVTKYGLFVVGVIFFILICASTTLALFQIHRFIYDEDKEAQRSLEEYEEAERRRFQEKLAEDQEGEGSQ